MPKLSTTEIPHSARRLYIKLYCERKGGKTNENLTAAAQSWLSLSATKKQHFRDTISTKSAIIVAQRIIKTKPYLKEINPGNCKKRKRNRTKTSSNLITSVNDCMECDNDQCSISLVEDNNSIVLSRESASKIAVELDKSGVGLAQIDATLEITAIPETEKVTNQNFEDCTLKAAQNELADKQDQHKTFCIQEDDTNSLKDQSIKSEENLPLPEPILPIIRNELADKQDQHKTFCIQEDDTNSLKDQSIKNEENLPLPEPILPIIRNELADKQDQHKTFCIQEDDTNSLKDQSIKNEENLPLPEPILPIIRKGKDLFELLKTRKGQGDKTYESLTGREKKFYANAACTIKKDYVKNYKKYLESLSARQLYEHFIKVSVPE